MQRNKVCQKSPCQTRNKKANDRYHTRHCLLYEHEKSVVPVAASRSIWNVFERMSWTIVSAAFNFGNSETETGAVKIITVFYNRNGFRRRSGHSHKKFPTSNIRKINGNVINTQNNNRKTDAYVWLPHQARSTETLHGLIIILVLL